MLLAVNEYVGVQQRFGEELMRERCWQCTIFEPDTKHLKTFRHFSFQTSSGSCANFW